MHDLIPLGPALPGALTTAEIDATMAYAEAEKALATRAAYASDWRDFAAWCASRGATALPAHVASSPPTCPASPTAAARPAPSAGGPPPIGYHHKMAGHEPPTNQEGVKAVLRGIRRTIGAAREGKAPATADVLKQMLALCPDTLARQAGPRAAGAGLRRRVPPLRAGGAAGGGSGRDAGRAARDDPAQQDRPGRAGAGGGDSPRLPAAPGRGGADVAGCGGDQHRPGVPCGEAGRARAGGAAHGARRGRDREAYARRVGPGSAPPTAATACAAGFLTSAAEAGASVFKMADQSLHRSFDTLRGYVRRARTECQWCADR